MRLKFVSAVLAGLFMAGTAIAQTAPASPPLDPQNILNLDLSTGGRVKILLRPDKAPNSVERIKTLVRRSFYDGLIFHRVIEGFMAQGGDPQGTGEGGSDLPDLKAEFNDLPHVRGAMSMARAQDPDSANSQFYIMLQPNLTLDGNYTVIGRVFDGMQFVDAIEKGEPPLNPSKIVHASIESDNLGQPPVVYAAPPAPAAAEPVLSEKEAKKARKKAKKARDAGDLPNAGDSVGGDAGGQAQALPPSSPATDAAVAAVAPGPVDDAVRAVTEDEAVAQPQ